MYCHLLFRVKQHTIFGGYSNRIITFGIILLKCSVYQKQMKLKCLCLSYLNKLLKYQFLLTQQKWLALPSNQREHLKSYIVNIVLEYGAIENLPKSLHNILSKANSILVQIVKYQWNSTWRSFINDICSASVKDMNIC